MTTISRCKICECELQLPVSEMDIAAMRHLFDFHRDEYAAAMLGGVEKVNCDSCEKVEHFNIEVTREALAIGVMIEKGRASEAFEKFNRLCKKMLCKTHFFNCHKRVNRIKVLCKK